MFGRNKKTAFYVVKNINQPNILLTITNTKKQCDEYINKLLLKENYNDFNSWCFYQKIAMDPIAWVKYYNTRLSDEQKSKYMIQKIYYRDFELAAILRMFCGCKAIGCSFDIKEESAYVESKKMIQEALEKKFKEYLDQFTMDDEPENDSKDKEDLVQ